MSLVQSQERNRSILISRITICAAVGGAIATYFWRPAGAFLIALDLLVRTYLHFVAGAMAHEGVHGHLGNSKSSNRWWSRLALISTTVPEVTFRKTHIQHHAETNVPDKDPDEFLNTAHAWQIPLRAIAMPHHWLVWLYKKGRLTRTDLIEFALTYLGLFAIYGTIAAFVGVQRVLFGLLPAAILHSLLLWYFFAIKTHEGYYVGMAAGRSHNYYGKLLYWLSFGLSMHRTHHIKPQLAWLQMASKVQSGTSLQRLRFERDIDPSVKKAA
ncbi:fatty acid desaturase [bacterium]|nr:fatty acid desaturase [bacterium]MCI0612314.1 fatty acid desaturase [bacterium]